MHQVIHSPRLPLRQVALAALLAAAAVPAVGVTLQERIAAASETAGSSSNTCLAARPFYWEVGSASQQLAGGSVNADGDPKTYTRTSRLNLGSTSKWVFAAYVLERTGGTLTSDQQAKLQHLSGYVSLGKCYPGQTVGSCYRYEDNETLTPEAIGKFDYDGGHMQRLAMDLGLGKLKRQQLASEVLSYIGTQLPLGFSVPMPAGGANGTPAGIAAFLRKLMNQQMVLGAQLGASPVCTNPTTCAAGEALGTPVPLEESWTYSLGHWVESDPVRGDGSFSSPGTLGFYPWISANVTSYGMIARDVDAGNSWPSVQCGRQVRKAWQTGVPQHDPQ